MSTSLRMRKRKSSNSNNWDNFEKNELLGYLYEFLAKKDNIKAYLSKIYEWYVDAGEEYLSFDWMSDKESDENNESFDIFCKKHKIEAIRRCKMFRQLIAEKIEKNKNTKISTLENKIKLISKLFRLTKIEKDILGFYVRMKLNYSVENLLCTLFNHRCEKIALPSYFLPYSSVVIGNYLNVNNKLMSCGLLDTDYEGYAIVSAQTIKMIGQQFSSIQKLRELILNKHLKTKLNFNDFSHIDEKDFCLRLLKGAIKTHSAGINILLYGRPGTGKTEFAKALCQKAKAKLYAVGEKSEDSRMEKLYMLQNALTKDKGTCLLIDEADDLMEERKIRVNRMLENNSIPCIWIVNSIHFLDKAYLRRFAFAIEFKMTDTETKTRIWQRTFKQNDMSINSQTARKLAEEYNLTPSFIANAIQAAKLAQGGMEDIRKNLNAMEKAYHNGREKEKKNIPVKEEKKFVNFNSALLNTDTDLQKFTEQVKNLHHNNFSLCLYGVSGTGKSAFAEYLAEQLDMPVLKKNCSDLLSMWHGETEQNIASAFREARENKALLIFDEADSFLQSRQYAVRSWEVTQVNEMLTQMEKHDLPFVCTTNLVENLDKASLRRFTFKVEYKYMTSEQNSLALEHFFGFKNVDLSYIGSLTPGDFAVVRQKAEIMGFSDNKDEIIKMLELEQKQKEPITRHIGFCL
ncbi:MAG: ATP-binding protein [Alphaproteobacteria bacterium]|nr:ATP-binding protein [Alphaproteobacteria bacterium]